MSSRAMAWAWEQKMKSGEKFILIALADRADEDGICWPSLRWLSEKVCSSKGAIKANIKKLIDDQFINREPRKRPSGATSSYLYRLSIPDYFELKKANKKRGSEFDPGQNLIRSESDPGGSESDPASYSSNDTTKNRRDRVSGVLPDWLDATTWQSFVEFRRKIRHPMSSHAERLAVDKLRQLKEDGNDPVAVIEQSILNDWRGLFPVSSTNNKHKSTASDNRRIYEERMKKTAKRGVY